MDDEIKSKFEDFDRKLSSIDKRFDDVKWYITGISSIFPVIFGIVALIFGLNISSEKAEFRESQKTIKEQSQKAEAELQKFEKDMKTQLAGTGDSKIEMYGINGLDLNGQEIPVTLSADRLFSCNKTDDLRCGELKWDIEFQFIMNNPSDYKTGDMYIKVYTKNPLNAVVKSSDEPKYDYEFPIDPVELFPSSLPGKYSMTYNLAVGIANNELPKAGRYPALLKVYYGAGKVASAPIYFVVLENARLVSSPPSRSLPPSPAVRRPAVNPGAAGRGTPTELH